MNKIYNDAKDEHVKAHVFYCGGEIEDKEQRYLYLDHELTVEATRKNTNVTQFDNIKIVNVDGGKALTPVILRVDPSEHGLDLRVVVEREETVFLASFYIGPGEDDENGES